MVSVGHLLTGCSTSTTTSGAASSKAQTATAGVTNTGQCSPKPLKVAGLPKVATVAANGFNSCAATSSGEVWCWGGTDDGSAGATTSAGNCHTNAYNSSDTTGCTGTPRRITFS